MIFPRFSSQRCVRNTYIFLRDFFHLVINLLSVFFSLLRTFRPVSVPHLHKNVHKIITRLNACFAYQSLFFFLVASSNLISQLPIASINSTTLGAHSFREPPRGKIINHTPLHGRTMSGDCPIFHLFEGLLLLLTITITPKVHFPNHKWCNLCFSLIFHYPQMLKILKLVPLLERYSLPEQQPLEREIHARFSPHSESPH